MINTTLVKFNLVDYIGFYNPRFKSLPDAYRQYIRVEVLEYSYKDPELGLITEEVYICSSITTTNTDEYVFHHLYDAIYYGYGVDLTTKELQYM